MISANTEKDSGGGDETEWMPDADRKKRAGRIYYPLKAFKKPAMIRIMMMDGAMSPRVAITEPGIPAVVKPT